MLFPPNLISRLIKLSCQAGKEKGFSYAIAECTSTYSATSLVHHFNGRVFNSKIYDDWVNADGEKPLYHKVPKPHSMVQFVEVVL